MPHLDGAHTHGSGGPDSKAVLAVLAVLLIVSGAAARFLTALAEFAAIMLAGVAFLGLMTFVLVLVYRRKYGPVGPLMVIHRYETVPAATPAPVPVQAQQAPQALPAPTVQVFNVIDRGLFDGAADRKPAVRVIPGSTEETGR